MVGIYIQKNIDNDTVTGIWKIEETLDWFISRLQLNKVDTEIVNRYKNGQRKLHWLSAKLLLGHLLRSISAPLNTSIHYDKNGKPHLANSPYKISISHSNKLVAIQLSKTLAGVDIQEISGKIERIAAKFMSPKEFNSLNLTPENEQIEQLHVYWGAKEALYKLYGKRGLHFKENLLIEPFEYKEKGIITGNLSTGKMMEKYSLHYEKIGDYMLVYVLGNRQ